MPDWVPQVAPDLCPACGAYWECEHKPKGTALTVEDMQTAVDANKDLPDAPPAGYVWGRMPKTLMFTRPLGPPLTSEEDDQDAP